MMKLMHSLIQVNGSESLWIAWIKEYVIKAGDFWQLEIKTHYSWCLKKLLKMRAEAYPILIAGQQLTIREIWEDIRGAKGKVTWHKIVWFPLHIPKHAMITWMTILNRLPTRDRLLRMEIVEDSMCELCGNVVESRCHLFFECRFSREIWENVLKLCGLSRMMQRWDDELDWAIAVLKGKSLIVYILKLAWQAHIYLVWEERNHRHFRGVHRSCTDILDCIKAIIYIRLQGRSIQLENVNRNLCLAWGIL
ncbi:hypothetical protein GQ457_04G001430 [Hibiscus cannabinus]